MQNSMALFLASALGWKHPFGTSLVQRMKIVCFSWNLIHSLTQIWRTQWWCSLFLFFNDTPFYSKFVAALKNSYSAVPNNEGARGLTDNQNISEREGGPNKKGWGLKNVLSRKWQPVITNYGCPKQNIFAPSVKEYLNVCIWNLPDPTITNLY